MHTFYPALKHSHLLFVALSILLFNLRFWLRTARPERPLPKILRLLPHLNDTLLLCTGMLLMHLSGFSPLVHGWLAVKLLLMVLYIGGGMVCLKRLPRSRAAYTAYAACLLLLAAVLYLAHYKPF